MVKALLQFELFQNTGRKQVILAAEHQILSANLAYLLLISRTGSNAFATQTSLGTCR